MKRTLSFRFSVVLVIVAAAMLLGAGMLERLQTVCADPEIRTTAFPSTSQPDQVCLTWSSDPQTTQTIQWRTSQEIKDGEVQYRAASSPATEYIKKTAAMTALEEPGTSNDPINHRYSAVLEGLSPNTAYAYRVGSEQGWSDWSEFTTAPQTAVPFSFVYMGDPQLGLDFWGTLVHAAYKRHPGAAFYVVAGDNVNRGHFREEWDNLFQAARGVFDRRTYVPALGNHDCPKLIGPRLYLDLLTLPENGPKEIGPERAYSFNYSNALFVVLDSNSSVEAQLPWLEEQLKSTKALWKFAVYHHPAYSSAPNRDNIEVREQWGALFDKYHVDMALQGHDHGYLRTKPMRAGVEAASPAEGTIYVVSVSGTKYYEVEQHDFADKTFDHLSVYQTIDIETDNGNKLTYRAYDVDGNMLDELIIVK
jgi:hypothetical protein